MSHVRIFGHSVPVLRDDQGLEACAWRTFGGRLTDASAVLDAAALAASVFQEALGDYTDDNSAAGGVCGAHGHYVPGRRAHEL